MVNTRAGRFAADRPVFLFVRKVRLDDKYCKPRGEAQAGLLRRIVSTWLDTLS